MAATSRTAATAADGTPDPSEMCYVMQRAAGGGTLLGGCAQVGNWDPAPDLELAAKIMRRAVELCPELTGGKGVDGLSVIRHGVGLRPVRTGGVRIERECVRGVWVVHNYGHGGFGYQSSYGCAGRVVGLVGEVLGEGVGMGEGMEVEVGKGKGVKAKL